MSEERAGYTTLPDCTGCTDPRSEGTHQANTVQHPPLEDAAEFPKLESIKLRESLANRVRAELLHPNESRAAAAELMAKVIVGDQDAAGQGDDVCECGDYSGEHVEGKCIIRDCECLEYRERGQGDEQQGPWSWSLRDSGLYIVGRRSLDHHGNMVDTMLMTGDVSAEAACRHLNDLEARLRAAEERAERAEQENARLRDSVELADWWAMPGTEGPAEVGIPRAEEVALWLDYLDNLREDNPETFDQSEIHRTMQADIRDWLARYAALTSSEEEQG